MNDRQLARDFWLHEFPCWKQATEANVERLQETVARVLQPIRNRWGPVVPTSWMWWSADCIPRTGSHARGGTVDFVTPEADLWEVFKWGNTYIMPSGYVGRWIYEPETEFQGEHIHCAPRRDMIEYTGDGSIQALQELEDGETYLYAYWGEEGTELNPYQMEPLRVVAEAGWGTWLGLGLFFAIFGLDMSWQSQGGWSLRTE